MCASKSQVAPVKKTLAAFTMAKIDDHKTKMINGISLGFTSEGVSNVQLLNKIKPFWHPISEAPFAL